MGFKSKRAAIELSINFIVVIIISVAIVSGGLVLFFKMIKSAEQQVTTIDQQKQQEIKSMMIANGYRVVAYPTDIELVAGDFESVGLGITNVYPDRKAFYIMQPDIKRIGASSTTGVDISNVATTVTLGPNEQIVKSVMLKLNKGAPDGQYIVTIKVTVEGTARAPEDYGVVKIYVTKK